MTIDMILGNGILPLREESGFMEDIGNKIYSTQEMYTVNPELRDFDSISKYYPEWVLIRYYPASYIDNQEVPPINMDSMGEEEGIDYFGKYKDLPGLAFQGQVMDGNHRANWALKNKSYCTLFIPKEEATEWI